LTKDSEVELGQKNHGKKPLISYSEDCGFPNGSCNVNPGVVLAGASLSSSVELQNSEVASCHKYASVSPRHNEGSLDLSDPKNTSEMEHGRPLNSSEINFVTDGNNFPSQTEEWVWCFSPAFVIYVTSFQFFPVFRKIFHISVNFPSFSEHKNVH
jgi:hypothetical protein